jgi:hypothetical protein
LQFHKSISLFIFFDEFTDDREKFLRAFAPEVTTLFQQDKLDFGVRQGGYNGIDVFTYIS